MITMTTKITPEDIYGAYPYKKEPRTALRAIAGAVERLRKTHGDWAGEYLLELTRAYAASPAGQKPDKRGGPDFRKYPATWFNGDCYHDDQESWEKPNGDNAARARTDALKNAVDKQVLKQRAYSDELRAQAMTTQERKAAFAAGRETIRQARNGKQ